MFIEDRNCNTGLSEGIRPIGYVQGTLRLRLPLHTMEVHPTSLHFFVALAIVPSTGGAVL